MQGLIPLLIFGVMIWLSSAATLNQQLPNSQAKIVKEINKLNDDGTYTVGFEADDGSFKVGTRSKDGSVTGKYGFIDANGQMKTAEYSTGKKIPPSGNAEPGTSATETETLSVRPKPRENRASEEKSTSAENSSGGASSETSGEEEPAFNSFNTPLGQNKDDGETSELTKRQGQLGGPSGGGIVGSPYAGQGQPFRGSQPYNPTTQLVQGGQFVDTRGQGQFGGPQAQYFQGPGGAQPPYYIGGPQQYSVGGGFGPTHYVGRQYPPQYVSSPQFGGLTPSVGQYSNQGQINQLQGQDDDGFVSVPPGSYYRGVGPQSQQQPIAYNGQSPQDLQYLRPGYRPGPYPGPSTSGGQQFEGQQPNRFTTSPVTVGGPQAFNRGTGGSRQEYIPNPELDGFSEDNDQDGFVDRYQGNDASKEAADEKSPTLKTPTADRIAGQYNPQVLGPQVIQGQGRPGLGVSPYNEQELQQIQQPLRPQTPYVQQPQPQLNQFAFQAQQPQYQSYPLQQQYYPQPQFGGPQIRGPYILPGQGQFSGSVPYQGGPQFSLQGQQPQYIQGQGVTAQGIVQGRVNPQFVNVQGNNRALGSLPYDYIGGVGPNGFPLGGPQVQFAQQQQQQQQSLQLTPGQGQSPAGQSQHLTPTQGSVQVATSDSKKDGN